MNLSPVPVRSTIADKIGMVSAVWARWFERTWNRITEISDHGNLSGLTDNDHTQYLNSVSDTASINMTKTGQAVSGTVLPAGVDHSQLASLNTTNYTHLTAANHTDLTDGGATELHYHNTIKKTRLTSADSPYTVRPDDDLLLANVTTGNVQLNFPNGIDSAKYMVKVVGTTNACILQPHASDGMFEGAAGVSDVLYPGEEEIIVFDTTENSWV